MLKKYKPTIIFILKFLLIEVLFTQLYSQYLDYYKERGEVDWVTYEVANESSNLAEWVGFESSITEDREISSIGFSFDGYYRIRIVEGCNGVAVMIIFIAFIFAFGGRLIDMLVFGAMGIMLVHLSNIFRIALLAYIYVYHEQYGEPFHDYVFPVIIYGMVFLLWIVWVNVFVDLKKKKKADAIESK